MEYPCKKDEASRELNSVVQRLAGEFKLWGVQGSVVAAGEADAVISHAENISADLIMVCEAGRTKDDDRPGLSAISKRIIAGTRTSARICRARSVVSGRPVRILVGFNGSEGSKLAVNAILRRSWPAGCRVRLVAVVDSLLFSSIGRFSPQIRDAAISQRFVEQWAQNLCGRPQQRLENAGVRTEVSIRFGEAALNIVSEAEEWNADAIFLGPNSASFPPHRLSLGSVSLAAASQADRSVEICR
jgi:nucleotide-binding universal stress UspA family protein